MKRDTSKTYRETSKTFDKAHYPVQIGEKYGYLRVISDLFYLEKTKPTRTGRHEIWEFCNVKCECGKETRVRCYDLHSGIKTNCNCISRLNISNAQRKGSILNPDGYKECCDCHRYLKADKYYTCKRLYDGLKGECRDCSYISRMKSQHGILLSIDTKYFCEICKVRLYFPVEIVDSPELPAIFIDHCHTRNVYRGVLCQQCNLGLGGFKDNPRFLEAGIKYLTDKNAPTNPVLSASESLV